MRFAGRTHAAPSGAAIVRVGDANHGFHSLRLGFRRAELRSTRGNSLIAPFGASDADRALEVAQGVVGDDFAAWLAQSERVVRH